MTLALLQSALAVAQAPSTATAQQATHYPDGALFTLPGLIEAALRENPGLAASRAELESAQAAITSAAALHNPEIEILSGPQRARVPTAVAGTTQSLTLTQRLPCLPCATHA